jgi:hypothetical protein
MKKPSSSGNYPTTEQEKFTYGGDDTQPSTAVPRCTDFDLRDTYSRTRIGVWGDEQTHTVSRRGNKVTEGKNY